MRQLLFCLFFNLHQFRNRFSIVCLFDNSCIWRIVADKAFACFNSDNADASDFIRDSIIPRFSCLN